MDGLCVCNLCTLWTSASRCWTKGASGTSRETLQHWGFCTLVLFTKLSIPICSEELGCISQVQTLWRVSAPLPLHPCPWACSSWLLTFLLAFERSLQEQHPFRVLWYKCTNKYFRNAEGCRDCSAMPKPHKLNYYKYVIVCKQDKA